MHERADAYAHPACTLISRLHVYSVVVVSVHHMRYAHIVPTILLLLLYYDNDINIYIWYYIISNVVANFVNNTIITVVTVCRPFNYHHHYHWCNLLYTTEVHWYHWSRLAIAITATIVKMCTMNITKWLNRDNIIGLYYKLVRGKNLMGVKKLKWPSKSLTSIWFLS